MTTVKMRTLTPGDAGALLRFERENRHWFERHVDARDPAFYSPEGVAAHIAAYLSGYAGATWHPFILEDDDRTIVGRANLKDIDLAARSAEVGYRIAEHACGRGLATLALQRLVEEARLRWGLAQLVADVYVRNVGSAKVLERAGFSRQGPARPVGREDAYRFVLAM